MAHCRQVTRTEIGEHGSPVCDFCEIRLIAWSPKKQRRRGDIRSELSLRVFAQAQAANANWSPAPHNDWAYATKSSRLDRAPTVRCPRRSIRTQLRFSARRISGCNLVFYADKGERELMRGGGFVDGTISMTMCSGPAYTLTVLLARGGTGAAPLSLAISFPYLRW
jgi:hypothetical protein